MKELINKYIGGIQRFQLQLETLTPVAIRNGEVLSPLTDYHIEGNKLYLLDTDKLMNDIAQNNWLNDFENKVLEYSGNHSGGTETNAKKKNRFIADFLKEKGVSIKDYLKEENIRISHVKSDQEWVQLHSTIKTNHQAYIPGSSIKGAVRTAIMYYWLTEMDEGKNVFKEFINNIKHQLVKKILKREKVSSRNYKEIVNNKITEKQRSEQKDIEAFNKTWLINCLNEFECKISNHVFGESEGKYNTSSFFKVDDSLPIENKKLTVSSLQKKYRENLQTKTKRENKKQFTPSLQELIDVNTTTSLNLSIFGLDLDKTIRRNIKGEVEFLEDDLIELFRLTKQFSLKYLEKEIRRLDGFKEEGNEKHKGKSYEKSKISNLHKQLNSLKDQVNCLDNNETIMCIGFGKSIFLNTLMMALPYHKRGDDEDKKRPDPEDVIRNIVRILHPFHPANKYFPISYYITEIDSVEYPLGWMKISFLPNFESANLNKDDIIQGILIERSSPSKVEICIDGVKQIFNAIGLSKFEKTNKTTIAIGAIHPLQIVVMKDNLIKDLKFV